MARGGLEPPTPRFSVVLLNRSSSSDLQAIPVDLASLGRLGLSRILRFFHDC